MTLTTSSTEGQRARENRAYVRRLLSKRQPAFAAALTAAERDLCSPARPCEQQGMIAHRPSTANPEGYCFWCGRWRELSYLKSVCYECLCRWFVGSVWIPPP
jgi:hypothetical protein